MATQVASWVGTSNRAQGLVDGASGFHEYGGALYLACLDSRSYPPGEGFYFRLCLYRSADRGVSWTRLTPSRLFGPGASLIASGWDGGDFYAMLYEGDDWYQWQLWRYSIDSGSWTRISEVNVREKPVYDGEDPDPVPFYSVYGLSSPGRIVRLADGRLRVMFPVVTFR